MSGRFKGSEGCALKYEHDFTGVMTEIRYDMSKDEWSLIITDEIAKFYGYRDVDQLFESDMFLDAIIASKKNHPDKPFLKIQGVKQI